MMLKNKHDSTKPLFEYFSFAPFGISIKLQQRRIVKQILLDF